MDAALLPAAVVLDQLCLGGLWTRASYQQELNRESSIFLGLSTLNPFQGQQDLLAMTVGWRVLEELHITLLAVHPNHRRQGLGTALLQSLLILAGDQGLERATLEVRQSNQAALGLYTQLGFRVAGQRRNYYSDGEDGLILWCSGIHQPEFQADLQQSQQKMTIALLAAGWQFQNQLSHFDQQQWQESRDQSQQPKD